MNVIIKIVLLATSTSAFAAEPSWSSKASPWLLKQYQNKISNIASSSTPTQVNPTVMIYMTDVADLKALAAKFDASTPRSTRITAVFNALVATSETSQSSIRHWLTNEQIIWRPYYISNMIVADSVSSSQLEEILKRPDVLRVIGNPKIKNEMPSAAAAAAEEPGLAGPGPNIVHLGATKVWNEFNVRGENIVVAGQDTGVRWDHVALKNHYRGWDGTTADHSYSWHDSVHKTVGGSSACGYNVSVPCDDHDHGTHTLGTVVGDDNAGNQIGVAPGAKWIGCRNMDAGMGNPEMYTECFQWFLAPWPQNGNPVSDARPQMAPHVINNSWGCPKSEGCDGNEFERPLNAMQAAGIFVVASAGNDGPACSTINAGPAFHTDLVLSVGASDHRSDAIASFSSRGPSTFNNNLGPDVSAPGVSIRSAVKSGAFNESGWSGTSMAGPHLVGLVALLWSADPTLIGKIDETKQIIKTTADHKTSTQTCGGVAGSAIPNNTFGYGLANAYEAVKSRKHVK